MNIELILEKNSIMTYQLSSIFQGCIRSCSCTFNHELVLAPHIVVSFPRDSHCHYKTCHVEHFQENNYAIHSPDNAFITKEAISN